MTGERTIPGLYGSGFKGYADPNSGSNASWMDVNWRLLSLLAGRSVVSRSTNVPVSGNLGDVYIVPSGDATNPNKLAIWDGPAGSESWHYVTPQPGWEFFVQDASEVVHYDEASWILLNPAGLAEAPIDDLFYARQNGAWVAVSGSALWNYLETLSGSSGTGPFVSDVSGAKRIMLILKSASFASPDRPIIRTSSDGGSSFRTSYYTIPLLSSVATLSGLPIGGVSNVDEYHGIVKIGLIDKVPQAFIDERTIFEYDAKGSGLNAVAGYGFIGEEVINAIGLLSLSGEEFVDYELEIWVGS